LERWSYNKSFIKRRLAKFGYTPESASELNERVYNDPEGGWNSHFAMGWVIFALFFLILLIETFFRKYIVNLNFPSDLIFVIEIAVIFMAIYHSVYKKKKVGNVRKEKYLFYFDEFERKPHKTKVCYGIISVLMLVAPLAVGFYVF